MGRFGPPFVRLGLFGSQFEPVVNHFGLRAIQQTPFLVLLRQSRPLWPFKGARHAGCQDGPKWAKNTCGSTPSGAGEFQNSAVSAHFGRDWGNSDFRVLGCLRLCRAVWGSQGELPEPPTASHQVQISSPVFSYLRSPSYQLDCFVAS